MNRHRGSNMLYKGNRRDALQLYWRKVLKVVDEILEDSDVDAVLIKHRPFVAVHKDVDLVVKYSDIFKILRRLRERGSSLKVERYKIQVKLDTVELDIHAGITWWNVLLLDGCTVFNHIDESRKLLYKEYDLDKLKRLHVVASYFDTFVLLLAKLYQDFEITYQDLLHIVINDDLEKLCDTFKAYGFSKDFLRMLLSFLRRCTQQIQHGSRTFTIPLTLFIISNIELVFRSKFCADMLSRVLLMARNVIWYSVLRLRKYLGSNK